MGIQEYCTKILGLAHKAELEDQVAKALTFRGLHSKDQDRIMLANSIKTETELKNESLYTYAERIIRLIRREEVRRQDEKPERTEATSQARWSQEEDLMELNHLGKETRRYFKCGKTGHI